MKKNLIYLAILIFLPALVWGQTPARQRAYVVIGVFAKLDNAIHYTEKANKNGFDAHFEINPARNWNYVYLLNTDDHKKAYAYMIKMRVETDYKDCWVFIGKLGGGTSEPVVTKPVEKPKEKPSAPLAKETVKEKPKEKVVEPKPLEPVKEPRKDSVVAKPVVAKKDSVVTTKPEAKKPEAKKPVGKPFLFKLVNAKSGNPLTGEVHILESPRAVQYQIFPGNEVTYIKAPVNTAGTYTLITQVPGYQQTTITFSYNDQTLAKGDQGETIVPLNLELAKAGNYIDFNHVKFIRNSAILLPESQNELDGLAALMNENKKYRIKIHAHCNGKQNRDITIKGSSKKFFGMEPGANKKISGASAKLLTEERGELVKAYLESLGIGADRISVKGEGGRIPLYLPGSTLVDMNDRIEIEISKN